MEDQAWKIGMKFITCLLVMYPLTLIKTIKVLNYIASLSIVFVFVSVIFVLVKFGQWKATGLLNDIVHPTPSIAIWPASAAMVPDVLTYITMFFSLYSMHASIVCIMYEYCVDFKVAARDVGKQLKISIYGVTLPIAFIVYSCYGLIGVLMFD